MQLSQDLFIKHNRIIGLDILRALAVLIVLYAHSALVLPLALQANYSRYLPPVDGVSLFFSLSGFLIGGIILKTLMVSEFTKADLLNFWIRRWIRTLPNYFLVLALIIGYRMLVFHDIRGFRVSYLFFGQNLAWPHPDFFREAWSLCVEEWFYLLFPILCFSFYKVFKNASRAYLCSVLLLLILPVIFRIIKFEYKIGIQNFDEGFRKVVLFRLDSLMYGIIASYLFAYKRLWWKKYRFAALGVGVALCIAIKINPANWIKAYPPLYFNIDSFTILCFMPFFSELKSTGNKLVDSIFTGLSTLSYALYLVNFTLVIKDAIPTTHNLLGWKNLPVEQTYHADYIFYWAYTLIGAWMIYFFYERHMTKLRDKIHLPTTSNKKHIVASANQGSISPVITDNPPPTLV